MQIIHLQHITEINNFNQCKTNHPLVAVFDFGLFNQYKKEEIKISADFYSIIFKNYCANTIEYGRQSLDFREGSLVCIGPKQIISLVNAKDADEDTSGWGLFFHPDLLYGTALGAKISEYSFFSYDMTEALHLSIKERDVLADCIKKIETELQENIDNHSQTLLVSNIELMLNYCNRYYDRQFITRKKSNSSVVQQVERLLKAHLQNSNQDGQVLPTVKFLADKTSLSPSYLSDLLKKETGMNAQDHIHYQLIESAKNLLLSSDLSVSELAYSLGFEYPQYFSRLFKQKTGLTPLQFRNRN